jgi:HD-GYP domain-containing protein (c-di-GMP phosphodiesterase class II)
MLAWKGRQSMSNTATIPHPFARGDSATPHPARWLNALWIALGGLVLVALIVLGAIRFIVDDRERAVLDWQIRLGIIADSRAAAVDEWLGRHIGAVQDLAENTSLQLYLTQVEASGENLDGAVGGVAELAYLRNVLIATADRAGFVFPTTTGRIAANVETPERGGLLLVDSAQRVVVVTPNAPLRGAPLRDVVAAALADARTVVDIFPSSHGQPMIGIAAPIFAVQGDHSHPIGAIAGVVPADAGFYGLLKQPGDVSASGGTTLVRGSEPGIEFLSPLSDATPPLRRTMAADTPKLAQAFALEHPGSFAADRRDYDGTDVLVTSRPLSAVPWLVVRTVSRAEALNAAEARLRTTLIVSLALAGSALLAAVAVWRHASSRRAAMSAETHRIAAERFHNMSKFMRVVTNSQPTSIVAVDAQTRYTFANGRAADLAGIAAEDMLGKTMASVMGPARAQAFAEINRGIFERFAASDNVEACRETHFHTFPLAGQTERDEEDGVEVLRSEHIPLRGDRDHPPGVLMVIDDLTELTRARRRSERTLNTLIDTLVGVVDQSDPQFAGRSLRVADVARSLALDLAVGDQEVATIDTAARLLNIGRAFVGTASVPVNRLQLGDLEENCRIHRRSADLVRRVPFDGPVVATLEHVDEHWDGSGPLGLAGEAILRSARILAVADAFVALISSYADREGLTLSAAGMALSQAAGSRFDRKLVSALINYLDNRGGDERWTCFRAQPDRGDAA